MMFVAKNVCGLRVTIIFALEMFASLTRLHCFWLTLDNYATRNTCDFKKVLLFVRICNTHTHYQYVIINMIIFRNS